MHIIRPYWLLSLFPLVILVFYYWRSDLESSENSPWSKICDSHLLKAMQPSIVAVRKKKLIEVILLSFIWVMMVLSLSGPSFSKEKGSLYANERSQVLLLDMSSVMQVSDLKPTRLVRARYKLIDYFKHITTGNVGLIAFTQWPFVVFPITNDADAAQNLVPQLTRDVVPTNGYNLAKALGLGKQLLNQIGQHKGDLIVVTAHNPSKGALTKAAHLRREGYRVSVWAMGTNGGGPMAGENGVFSRTAVGGLAWKKLPVSGLKRLAKLGGGEYIPVSSDSMDVTRMITLVSSETSRGHKSQSIDVLLWRDQGAVICWFVLLIGLVIFFRKNWI